MTRPITLAACAVAIASALSACAQEDLADFWQQGKVRELLLSGLPNDEAALADWAASGVNCVLGVKPEPAHKYGMKTRSWFTMNYMDSRNMEEATIKSMAAIRADGSYLRPFDPLFPTVGEYGWSACVNNPLWQEHSQAIFRRQATEGHDGCHIDFASHYEPCFCEHCRARWAEWAGGHGLELDLAAADKSEDLRVRMLVREFRIRSVIDFLAGVRAAGREVKPGFAIDGTYHQDNGSTYQWAYGEHFDLMCIEGTTLGPFPPEGAQVPFMKLSHVLSRRPDRRPASMSVTYHLLSDEQGNRFHGRMAPDRVRVALGEIISQGGVSWLGLGGPKTGSLVREHQEIVKAYYSAARDLEPALVDSEDIGECAIVFSAKSFLYSGQARSRMYAIVHALMRAHIPFRMVSDVGLQASDLAASAFAVVLPAPVLSDAGCTALDEYVRGGGRALVIGDDAATLTEDWRPREDRPLAAVAPEGDNEPLTRELGRGVCHYWKDELFGGKSLGAAQYVELNQQEPVALAIEGYSRAEGVTGTPDSGYSLYVDLQHTDETPMWGKVATFATGTHDWQFSRCIITSDRPFGGANVHMLFRGHGGTVWFRDVRFGEWDAEKGQIRRNLLGGRVRDTEGKVYTAGPGENATAGAWGPYRDGFEVEEMLDMGLWIKMSSVTALSVSALHTADMGAAQRVMDRLQPLLPAQPMLSLTGEGADNVYVDLCRNERYLTVQLINYAAELHPELPELQQQEQDRSLPTGELQLSLRLPAGVTIDAAQARIIQPERDAAVTVASDGGTLRLSVERLHQYLAVMLPL